MENPRRGEKAGPRLDLALEHLRLGWHEESGVPADLPELGVPEAVLDDAVDEAQRDWVVLHLGVVEIIEQES